MLFCLIVAMNVIHIYALDKIEARVINGSNTVIEKHSYCAFLYVRQDDQGFICGASVLNTRILLSAAHCFKEVFNSTRVTAFFGNTIREDGTAVKVVRVKKHRKYNATRITNDIAIAALAESLQLGKTISKVSLVRSRPKSGKGVIAGWGRFQEDPVVQSHSLHKTTQKFSPRQKCEKVLHKLPVGTFCAGKKHEKTYPSLGDSGSPFVINGYVQIGLVSFRKMHISKSIIIYTDVSFFYDWIQKKAKKIFCKTKS